jgi:hypothetical protein
MATDKKISQLASGAPAQAGDEYVVARSGANYKLTLTNIAASMPATTITSGDLTFSSTAQRITGDMGNATLGNRLYFQTSVTNGNTDIMAVPNGTGTLGQVSAWSSSDPANSSLAALRVTASTDVRLISSNQGTGTLLPMTFYTGGSERVRIDTSGNVGIGVTPTVNLDVKNAGGNCTISAQYGTGTKGQLIAANNEVQLKAFNGTNDVLTFATGASERMRITSTGNVGIGITPSTKLHVYGAGTTSTAYTNGDATGPTLYLQDSGAGAGNGGQLLFGASQGIFAGIKGILTNGTGPAGDIVFQTRGTSGNVNERARVTSAGGFSVGTTADPGAGGIFATANITAYYSDARLKDFKGKIGDALYKVSQLNGYYYTENEKAEEFGYNNKELQVGVSAQEVKAVLPEVVSAAPFDLDADGKSKSGDDYMTVSYEKLVPLLIEAIKELKAEVEALKAAK